MRNKSQLRKKIQEREKAISEEAYNKTSYSNLRELIENKKEIRKELRDKDNAEAKQKEWDKHEKRLKDETRFESQDWKPDHKRS